MRIIDAAIGAAWAMEEPALRTLLEIATREHQITPEALAGYKADALEKGELATFRDGVAVLNVQGPLFKYANLMTAYCGASSYDVLMRDFTTALNDSNVRAILLNIDSPGGEAAGCAEFAAAIAAASDGDKPIVAYVGDLAASAAYWIASACDSIVLGPSGTVGSIGVRCSLSDYSAVDARSGVKRFDFVSSQSPFKVSDPKTEDGNARIQARVDALAEVFVQAVADNRGVTVPKVLEAFGQGDVKIGAAAVSAGMADGFGTFESVLAALSTSTDPLALIGLHSAASRGITRETATMPTTDEMNAAVESARTETAARLNAEHATDLAAATKAASAQAATDAAASAQTAERERVAGLFGATFAGYETARDEAIQSGSSVADFRALIVEKEHAKLKAGAANLSDDTEANARVKPSKSETKEASDEDKAVALIMGS